jgi:glucose-6-phosphate isomerase
MEMATGAIPPEPTKRLTTTKSWTLRARSKKVQREHLRTLFANDPKRGKQLTAEAVGLFLDYSKNRITEETLDLLIQLAEESDLRSRTEAMFRGEKINIAENSLEHDSSTNQQLDIRYYRQLRGTLK